MSHSTRCPDIIDTPQTDSHQSVSVVTTHIWQSPVGELMLGSQGDCLCLCDWTHSPRAASNIRRLHRLLRAECRQGSTPIIERAVGQLQEYFDGVRQGFDVQLLLAGTEFQRRVWGALMGVGYGATVTYVSLAATLGDRRACRAVAGAVASNPISIIVPCHRVIGSNGALTGYAGGLVAKQQLIEIESK